MRVNLIVSIVITPSLFQISSSILLVRQGLVNFTFCLYFAEKGIIIYSDTGSYELEIGVRKQDGETYILLPVNERFSITDD